MKTRLNQDRRETLQRLAQKVVRDTPIDPAIEKRVAKNMKLWGVTHEA